MKALNTWDAGLYDQKHSFVFRYGEDLLNLLQPQSGEHILDIGCGTGALTGKIADSGARVTGVDSAASMIAEAKKNFPEMDFRVMDARYLDFDQSFDKIFSNATLHWIKEGKEMVISGAYHLLKAGGKLVAEFGGKNCVRTITDALRNELRRRGYEGNAAIDFWYFPGVGEYAGLLEQQGFRIEYAAHFPRPTELADETTGIIDWLNMFASGFFEGIGDAEKKEILQQVQDNLYSRCFINDKWYADYMRLRVVAVKDA